MLMSKFPMLSIAGQSGVAVDSRFSETLAFAFSVQIPFAISQIAQVAAVHG
jgi:hypothetical protein